MITKLELNEAVNRFLAWKLPETFCPDGGIEFHPSTPLWSSPSWPTGTNLLDYSQAKAMFEHCLCSTNPTPMTATKSEMKIKLRRLEVGETANPDTDISCNTSHVIYKESQGRLITEGSRPVYRISLAATPADPAPEAEKREINSESDIVPWHERPGDNIMQKQFDEAIERRNLAIKQRDSRAEHVSPDEANELRDVLRTLAPTGRAFITSARELVAEYEKKITSHWTDGYPPKPYATEWFIALIDDGTRVCLRALPDDWSYDFKTADETYYSKSRIKKWMQFPDSDFKQIEPKPEAESAQPAATATGEVDVPKVDIVRHEVSELRKANAELLEQLQKERTRANGYMCESSIVGKSLREISDANITLCKERDQLQKVIDGYNVERDKLLAERNAAQAERDQLRERVALLESRLASTEELYVTAQSRGDDLQVQLAAVTKPVEVPARTRREIASQLRDIARRWGIAKTIDTVRYEIQRFADSIEVEQPPAATKPEVKWEWRDARPEDAGKGFRAWFSDEPERVPELLVRHEGDRDYCWVCSDGGRWKFCQVLAPVKQPSAAPVEEWRDANEGDIGKKVFVKGCKECDQRPNAPIVNRHEPNMEVERELLAILPADIEYCYVTRSDTKVSATGNFKFARVRV